MNVTSTYLRTTNSPISCSECNAVIVLMRVFEVKWKLMRCISVKSFQWMVTKGSSFALKRYSYSGKEGGGGGGAIGEKS